MRTKYIIIILLVLFIIVNIFINKDTFTNNKIYLIGGGFSKDLSPKNNKLFKNIHNINTKITYFEEEELPKLTFYSYEKCPKLYKLFKGLSSKEDNQIENIDGLRFRNKLRSTFYNIDRTIKIEHPLIDIERKLMPINIEGNINEKLNTNFMLEETNNIEIDTIEKYFIDINSIISNYDNLINAINLIFSYLNNRIPKKMSENFIRLNDILIKEKNKVLKIKNTDIKSLLYSFLDNNILPTEVFDKDHEMFNKNIYINSKLFLNNIENETENEDNFFNELNFNEQEKYYLTKIEKYFEQDKPQYSNIIDNIITLEILNEEKNKDFCSLLLIYIYYNIKQEEIEQTKKILEDYKINNLNLEYKIEEDTIEEIQKIKKELAKLKTKDNGDSELILANPNFIFELGDNIINYFTDNHIEQTHKQVYFNVKTDFTEDDVVNFVEYCFNLCCFGAIDIDLLSFTANHYRVLPCFNPIHNSNTYYYILPERIRKVVMEEGKEYTRAKCNGCASNIIIFFNKLPDKFKYYEAIEEPNIEKGNIVETHNFIESIL
jgi:hypothetical protein